MNYERLYEYRFRGVDTAAKQAVWNEIASHIYERMGRPEAVLDPAAGRGEFINAIPAKERWVVDEVDHAGGGLASGVKVLISDIFKADLPKSHFDGVFVSNFLEHLPSQERVNEFLQKMHSALKPGGRIAILGPNFRYCADKYFDCADHTLPLTHVAVAEHLYMAGFELLAEWPRFIPFSFRSRLPASSVLTRLYLRMPFAWRWFGEQFLLIARK